MKAMLSLAAGSAWNRRFVVSLVALSIALSAFLLLGIERLRADTRAWFAQSVSGTDLIVGPRTGAVQLLLYAVFRVGGATSALPAASADEVARHPAVAWTVPLSLGDSHKGFPVLGTSRGYFDHFRYGDRQPLQVAQGKPFSETFDAVLGAEVARALGHRLGDRLTLSHGDGAIEANDHEDRPFVVVGILAPTGTPVDRTVHIGLDGMDALHGDLVGGVRLPGLDATTLGGPAGSQRSLTAVLVGLKSRGAVFAAQRDIAALPGEPLMAILPGVTLDALWDVVGTGERGLQVMTGFVAAVSLAGLVAMILAGLDQRRRELAILRALGAGPRHILQLLLAEGVLITLGGLALGLVLHWAAVAVGGEWLRARYGVALTLSLPGRTELGVLAALLAGGVLASLLPAWRAYRLSLADGLSPRT